ncbi:MAG TPA: Asp-tRNA(Asn)/Glu-tRNA(Gln) amidotransferase subunit GatC [Terriglobales bacterium]|nr:Asp-tRNA(Asn)/Glu-tRNA(Gln) amidotransferase subunit GatC [Terriglobales bacterium]
MAITKQDVLYVAGLANLELTADEQERMVRDLGSILDYVGRLNELGTSDVAAMTQVSPQPLDPGAAFRADTLSACLPHDEAMKNAPATDGKFFKVPKVIER